MNAIAPNAAAVHDFLNHWYAGQPFTLTTIPADGGKPTGHNFTEPQAAAQWATMQNIAGRNVYFHVNPGHDLSGTGKLLKEEITGLHAYHVDIDPPEGVTVQNVDQWRQQTVQNLQAVGNPTLIACSGRGLAAYWKFATVGPENMDRIEQVNRALVRMFGGDKAAVDASRIMKLPGTVAYPNPDKRAAGWQTSMAVHIGGSGMTFDPVALETWAHQNAPAPQMPEPSAASAEIDDSPISPDEFAALCDKVTRKMRGSRKYAFALDTGYQTKADGDASDFWAWAMRCVAEVTSRRDVAAQVLLSLPWVDKTYTPDGHRSRREKCERELRSHWQAQVSVTAEKRATGSLEGLKDLAATVGADDAAVKEYAGHVSRLSTAERETLAAHLKDIRPDLHKPVKQAVDAAHAEFRVAQGEQVFGMLRGGALSHWYITGDDGSGKAKAVDRHTGACIAFPDFLVRFRHLPEVPIPTADGKIKMVPAAQHWWDHPETERYDRLDFDPDADETWCDDYGRLLKNEYRTPHNEPAAPGQDVAPYLHILAANYPDQGDQYILLSALAFAIQNPGKLLKWAPVLQGSQGCGKGVLVRWPLQHACGRNVGIANPKALFGDYNSYQFRKTVVVVDEIGDRSKAAIADISEDLKEPISEPHIPYRLMRRDPFDDRNFACWFFMTNHIGSMLVSDGERRYSPLVSALQSETAVLNAFPSGWWETYYPHVVQASGVVNGDWFLYYAQWWGMGGAEAVRGMLETYAPALPGRAPKTTTTDLAIAEGEPELTRLVREAVAANEPGFRGGFVSSMAVRALCEAEGLRPPGGKWFGKQIQQAGFPHNVRYRPTPADEMRCPEIRSKQARLYFCDNGLANRPPYDIVDAYDRAQTDTANAPPPSNVVPMKPPGEL